MTRAGRLFAVRPAAWLVVTGNPLFSSLQTPSRWRSTVVEGDTESFPPPLAVLPVSSSFLQDGYFSVSVALGTPPVPSTLVVDTNSHLVAASCASCPAGACGSHTNQRYNPANSSTAVQVPCILSRCQFTVVVSGFRRVSRRAAPPLQVLCADARCSLCGADGICKFSRDYPDGSSLAGDLVDDVLWFANATAAALPNTSAFWSTYRLGCSTRETSACCCAALQQLPPSCLCLLWLFEGHFPYCPSAAHPLPYQSSCSAKQQTVSWGCQSPATAFWRTCWRLLTTTCLLCCRCA